MIYRSRVTIADPNPRRLNSQNFGVRANIKTAEIAIPLSNDEARLSSLVTDRPKVSITFRNPIADDEQAQNNSEPPPGGPEHDEHQAQFALDPKLPWYVTCFNLGITQAACLMLLGAITYMPKQTGDSSWWSGAGSMASAVPNMLHGWEIIAAVLGLLLFPILKQESRSRFTLNLGLSLLVLMVLAICQQQLFAVELIFLPTLGILALVWLHAVSVARVYCMESKSLRIWQAFAAGAVLLLWIIPLMEELGMGYFDNIFSALGSDYIRPLFISGSLVGIAAGVIALGIDNCGRVAKWLNWITGAMAILSAVAVGTVCFLGTTKLSNVFDQSTQNSPWLGTGFMWLFLLIAGTILLIWSGLMQRFSLSALRQRIN